MVQLATYTADGLAVPVGVPKDQITQHFHDRMLVLMADARLCGVSIKANMPTAKETATYGTVDSFTVSLEGDSKVIAYPDPSEIRCV